MTEKSTTSPSASNPTSTSTSNPASTVTKRGDPLSPAQWPTQGRRLRRRGESFRNLPRPDCLAFRGNRLTRWIGWTALRLHGWDIRGVWPSADRVLALAAPHTCNYDAYLAIWVQMAINTRFSFFIKKEVFVWPLTYLWQWVDGIAVDRRKTRGMIEAVLANLAASDRFVFAVTPEGTRTPPKRLKSGIFRLSKELGIGCTPVTWDFDTKTIWFEEPFELVETFEEWEQQLYRYFDGIRGGEGYWMGVPSPNGRRLPDSDCPRPFTPGKEPLEEN